MKKFKCKRCDHTWVSRLEKDKPLSCPSCKSYEWDKKLNQKKNTNDN